MTDIWTVKKTAKRKRNYTLRCSFNELWAFEAAHLVTRRWLDAIFIVWVQLSFLSLTGLLTPSSMTRSWRSSDSLRKQREKKRAHQACGVGTWCEEAMRNRGEKKVSTLTLQDQHNAKTRRPLWTLFLFWFLLLHIKSHINIKKRQQRGSITISLYWIQYEG